MVLIEYDSLLARFKCIGLRGIYSCHLAVNFYQPTDPAPGMRLRNKVLYYAFLILSQSNLIICSAGLVPRATDQVLYVQLQLRWGKGADARLVNCYSHFLNNWAVASLQSAAINTGFVAHTSSLRQTRGECAARPCIILIPFVWFRR